VIPSKVSASILTFQKRHKYTYWIENPMVRGINTVNGISRLLNELFKSDFSGFELTFCRKPNSKS
jgi:hypothetical protein